ncbi:hypothetical protein AAF712_004254 [Marasmius tenuissimus]|uniref:Aldehyde dehydrogenase domain-containing protein n=1 Tax=Marasmius tenuissimus TaxID=585030 RepID=A0ABR3A4W0_9AGAR
MASRRFELPLDTPAYKGTVSVNTSLFIGGKWVEPAEGGTIDIINPATGKPITTVSVGTEKDVDNAVEVAKKTYKTSWGLKVPGAERGKLLNKLADLVESNIDELSGLESLNVGKPFGASKYVDITNSITILRYFAGNADKLHGETIETSEQKFAYTRREPYGVVGLITPWNFPLVMLCAKMAPAVAAGNVVVCKASTKSDKIEWSLTLSVQPSEMTPLTALRLADLVNEAGFPPGVINIVNGLGTTVGNALAHHPQISRISFTGSTLTGRKIQEASAKSNLKVVTLELGGKSPSVVFDDCDLEQTIKWTARGIFFNMGELCIAGSRIFVQEGIYEKFLAAFKEVAKGWSEHTGDPFEEGTQHGPQISQAQFDRVMGYIDSAKQDGATILTGGSRHGNDGYFIEPTIITDTRPDMKVVREEIFGPVASIIKFKTEEEAIEMANDTSYGLACGIFTQNNARATRVAHALEAGTAWVCHFGSPNSARKK